MHPPFKIWCERAIPDSYLPLLDGAAVVVDKMPEADAVLAAARLRYDAALFRERPALRVISRTGIGYDNISVADATAHRIAVCNVPDGPSISTAEHTMALMLAVAKKIKSAERKLERGERSDFFTTHKGVELAGKTLGVVGAGRIGLRVARLGAAFGMRVSIYDPIARPEGFELVSSLDELLERSDILTLHLPLTSSTRHLINREKLDRLKFGAFVINAARGGLIDESALLDALKSGRVQGAGLDVFEKEPPPPDHPLLNREDVVATPHIAAATDVATDQLWRVAIMQALQVLRGERPPHLVNPEVMKP